jgi:hypothetical protein
MASYIAGKFTITISRICDDEKVGHLLFYIVEKTTFQIAWMPFERGR